MRVRALSLACAIILSGCEDASRPTTAAPTESPTFSHRDSTVLASAAGSANVAFPLEPAGMTALTSRPFSSKATSWSDASGAEGWSTAEASTRMRLTADPAAPQSAPSVASFDLLRWSTGGSDAQRGAATYNFSANSVRSVYATVWLRVSPNWRGPRSGSSAFVHLIIGRRERASLGMRGSGSGPFVPTTFLTGAPDTRRELAANLSPTTGLAPGRWQRWDFMIALNTPGSANGVLRWWVDGQPVAAYEDVAFVADDERGHWSAFQARLAWGTTLDRAPSDMRFDLDHAYLAGSAQPPGSSVPVPPVSSPNARSITVTPRSAAVATGDSVQFVATVRDSAGLVMPNVTVAWRTTNPAIATAGATGIVRGIAAGATQLIAQAGTIADSAAITVSASAPPAPTVTAVVLSPASATVQAGASQQFTAAEQLSNGTSRSASGVSWSATGGTVTGSGMYTAGASAGSYRVIALGSSGHADTASITVTAPPPPPPPPPPGACVAPTLLSHGFDNQSFAPLSGTEGAYITADATARGGYSVRKDWTGGSHDGSTIWANFTSTRTVYARWRFKYDARFDTDGIFKMIRFHAPNMGTMNGTLLIQWGRFVWAWDTFASGVYQNVGAEITPASLAGGWHWYEIMNDISVNGSPRVRMWIDGVLKMDATLSSTAATNGLSFGTLQWTGTYNSPAATATSWLDDVAISTSCIGVPTP